MALWVLETLQAIEFDGKINDVVQIQNGTVSVDLSCGEFPDNSIAIEWFIYSPTQLNKILKIYLNTSGSPRFYNNYTEKKYDIGDSSNTSLVVKNIELSDATNYTCSAIGGKHGNMHTTMLKVVGKSVLKIFNAPLYMLLWQSFCTGIWPRVRCSVS